MRNSDDNFSKLSLRECCSRKDEESENHPEITSNISPLIPNLVACPGSNDFSFLALPVFSFIQWYLSNLDASHKLCNCQRFNYTKNFCHLEPRCLKCASRHHFSISASRRIAPTCVNCGKLSERKLSEPFRTRCSAQ